MCGVVGVVLKEGIEGEAGLASFHIFDGLQGVQHRGQDGNGILTLDITAYIQKDLGFVREVHNEESLKKMKGRIGLGHTRYPTVYFDPEYKCSEKDLAPFYNGHFGIGLVHNGQINNWVQIKNELIKKGVYVDSSCDSEVLLGLYCYWFSKLVGKMTAREAAFESAKKVLDSSAGSTSACLLIRGLGLLAFRDYNGITPLHLGEWSNNSLLGYMFASETLAFWPLFRHKNTLERGEVILIDNNLEVESRIIKQKEERYCSFQNAYFCRAPSLSVDGRTVNAIRTELGRGLGKFIKEEILKLEEDKRPSIDILTFMPETAKAAALSVYKELLTLYPKLEFAFGFEKAKGVPIRNFIMGVETLRAGSVAKGLVPMEDVIRGKDILIIDDSLVRGTTSRNQARLLRKAGAKSVYWGITVPPIKYPCFWGIDFQTKGELIAANKSIEDIREYIGADRLWYMPLENYKEVMGADRNCFHCLDGVAPTKLVVEDFSLD